MPFKTDRVDARNIALRCGPLLAVHLTRPETRKLRAAAVQSIDASLHADRPRQSQTTNAGRERHW